MNLPSVKAISQIAGVERKDAIKVRRILECRNIEAVAALSNRADSYIRSCYGRPTLNHVKLIAADEFLGTYGVEYIAGLTSPSIEYCNAGDTYALTLLWTKGRYRVIDWGTLVERGNYI